MDGEVGDVSEFDGGDCFQFVEGVLEDYKKAFADFDLKKACEILVGLTDYANKYIDEKKPWAMAKEGDEGLAEVLYNLLELLRYIAALLVPILPGSTEKIVEQIGLELGDLGLEAKWGLIKKGTKITSGESLFPRIEEDLD